MNTVAKGQIVSVNVGAVREIVYRGHPRTTAIWKEPVSGPVMVGRLGLDVRPLQSAGAAVLVLWVARPVAVVDPVHLVRRNQPVVAMCRACARQQVRRAA